MMQKKPLHSKNHPDTAALLGWCLCGQTSSEFVLRRRWTASRLAWHWASCTGPGCGTDSTHSHSAKGRAAASGLGWHTRAQHQYCCFLPASWGTIECRAPPTDLQGHSSSAAPQQFPWNSPRCGNNEVLMITLLCGNLSGTSRWDLYFQLFPSCYFLLN